MSIDDRLRGGLAANTEHLASDPALEVQLGALLRRAHRRRQTRVAGVALVAAAVAVAAWLGGLSGWDRSQGPPRPVKTPKGTEANPWSMEGVDGPLEPGAWAVPLFDADYRELPRAVVQVPPGYGSPGGWAVDRGADGDPEHHGDVSFWVVDTVVDDPCRNGRYHAPGPSAAALARALTRQDGSETTRPRPVTLDGFPGRYVEVVAPDRHRLARCQDGSYTLWRSDAGDPFHLDIAHTVARLWILDVAGTRIVVAATTTPAETEADVAEVTGIAHSTHFTDVSPSSRSRTGHRADSSLGRTGTQLFIARHSR